MNKINNIDYQNKRVLVTGGNGFVGKHLIKRLVTTGAKVYSIDVNNSISPTCDEFVGNLQNIEFVNKVIKELKPQFIFHLAAYKERAFDFNSFNKALNTNVIGSLNLFTALCNSKDSVIESVVVIGTTEEYGNNEGPFDEDMREMPVSAYSYSKVCLTHLCQLYNKLYNMPAIIIRPSIAYGPGQGNDLFIPSMITTLLDGHEFFMSAGEQKRDFIFIDDLLDSLLLAACNRKAHGEIINVGNGISYTLLEIAKYISNQLNSSDLLKIGAINYRKNEMMNYSLDISKAKKLLNWNTIVDIYTGIDKTIDYYRNLKIS